MATTKTTTKKKTTSTKTIQAEIVTPAVEEVRPVLTRFKFIANCNNINISHVIFNNIKVVINLEKHDKKLANYEAAFDNFQEAVTKMFNGDITKYNQFMAAVFGGDVLVESTKVDQIKQDIAVFH